MNCRRAKRLVYDFLDGLVADKDRLELDTHLTECRECETMATQLTRSLDLLRRAPQEQLDENFNWKVRLRASKERHALHDQLASRGPVFRAWNIRYAATALASFGLIVAAGVLAFRVGVLPFEMPVPRAQQPTQRVVDVAEPAGPAVRQNQNNTSGMAALSNGGFGGELVSRIPLGSSSGVARGAIDRSQGVGDLDSLVRTRMQGMTTEDERIRYLRRRIHLLQSHLEKCEARKHSKP